MKIYTRRGDTGETSLPGGVRVWKNSPCIDAIGAIDELNAALGLLRSEQLPEQCDRLLERLQKELFIVGTELASVMPTGSTGQRIEKGHVQAIEAFIDQYDVRLQPMNGFILPGGVRTAALFHVARTICRRAERNLATLVQSDKQAISADMLAYMNRFSDLLFILARESNAQAGIADTFFN
jgi:cob(I)alamin adenosyltransferase